jgi:hypothetical protein
MWKCDLEEKEKKWGKLLKGSYIFNFVKVYLAFKMFFKNFEVITFSQNLNFFLNISDVHSQA